MIPPVQNPPIINQPGGQNVNPNVNVGGGQNANPNVYVGGAHNVNPNVNVGGAQGGLNVGGAHGGMNNPPPQQAGDPPAGVQVPGHFRLSVPSFNGERNNIAVVSFLSRAQLWVRASGASDAEAASAIIFAFSGAAAVVGHNLVSTGDPAATSWIALKEVIRRKYLTDVTAADRKTLLADMRQGPTEFPLDFWERLTAVQHLLDAVQYSDRDRTGPIYRQQQEQYFQTFFMAGIDPELSTLISNNPTVKDMESLRAAVVLHWPQTAAAKKLRAKELGFAPSGAAAAVSTAEAPVAMAAPAVKTERTAEMSVQEMDVAALRTEVERLRRGMSGRGRGRGQRGNRGGRGRGRGVCFRCGAGDHFVANCNMPDTRSGRGGNRGRGGAAPHPSSRGGASSNGAGGETMSAAAIEELVNETFKKFYEGSNDDPAAVPEKNNVTMKQRNQIYNINSLAGLNNARPYLNVTVAGKEMRWLCDTGSSISCIRKSVFDQLPAAVRARKKPLPAGTSFKSASNSKVAAEFIAELPLMIQGKLYDPFPVIVCAALASEAILGADFMKKYNAVIHVSDKQVLFSEAMAISNQVNAAAVLARSVTLPPYSCTSASITLKTLIGEHVDSGLKCEIIRSAVESVEIETGLCECKEGLKIRLSNTNAHSVKLDKGLQIADVEVFDTDTEICELHWSDDDSKPIKCAPPSAEKKKFIDKEAIIGTSDPVLRQKYLDLLYKHHDVVSMHALDFGKFRYAKHHIKTRTEEPVHSRQYPVPHEARPAIQAHLQKMLVAGVITPCRDSAYNSPFFMIRKRDGVGWRFLTDLRKVNEQSVDDRYLFKDFQECVDEIAAEKSSLFSVLDICAGYYNVRLTDESMKKTAFTLPHNVHLEDEKGKRLEARWMFRLMSMGLHGAGASFGKVMAYTL